MPVNGADVGGSPSCRVSHFRVGAGSGQCLAHWAVFGQGVERYVERWWRDQLGDAVVLVRKGADLEVGLERPGDLVADEVLQRHSGRPPHELADEVPEGQRVISRRHSRRPPRRLAGEL